MKPRLARREARPPLAFRGHPTAAPLKRAGARASRTITPGAKLGAAYQQANRPVAKRRLYRAGVRPARVLDDAVREDR